MVIFSHLNYIAVIVSALVYFFIGALWYSFLFRKPWMEAVGADENKPSKQVVPFPLLMLGQLVSTILFTIGLAVALQLVNPAGLLSGLLTAIGVIVLFVVPLNTGSLFFQGKPKLFCIDAGYQAAGAFVSCLILTLWR